MPLHFATITSPNYWPQTRVLAESLRQHAPDAIVHALLLADGQDPAGLPGEPNVRVYALDQLGLPAATLLPVRFNLMELACALKPPFLNYLLETIRSEAVVYIDSDMMFFHTPALIEERLRECDLLLTPHFADIADPTGIPFEIAQLTFGTYNGGFLGVRACDNARRFLRWWGERALRYSCEDPAAGVFTDQQWLDLVPGLFANVRVERHPGFNVARWNLSGRMVECGASGYTVNGEPLVFFHFTQVRPGIDVSDYLANRRVSPALEALFQEYLSALVAKGCKEGGGPPAQDLFPNGRKIPRTFRQFLRGQDAWVETHQPASPQEAVRQLVIGRDAAGARLRAVTYHQSRQVRTGSADDTERRYRTSMWFRCWVDAWFYFFAPRVLNVPVEWVEPSPWRRRLRGGLAEAARVASTALRRLGL